MGNPCHETAPVLLRRGIAQFNRGEFFEQHETLEDLWREESRPIRTLYQGILQIGVALYHVQRQNHHGAVYMLTRGTNYLRPFAPACQGVDVADLLAATAEPEPPSTPWTAMLDAVNEHLELGSKKANRSLEHFLVTHYMLLSIDEDIGVAQEPPKGGFDAGGDDE